MLDSEKVVKGLYAHGYKDCKSCPYWGSGENGKSLCTQLAREAFTLLKEQDERIKQFELEKSWDESPDMMGKW